MSKRMYVGNLSFVTTEDALAQAFSAYGEVLSSTIIKDRDTNQSKGFGFVEMDDSANCDKAIAELAGREFDGRKIRVNYAEEKQPRPRMGRDTRDSRDCRRGPRNFGRSSDRSNRNERRGEY